VSNKIKEELEKIEIPKELHERSKLGVQKAKSEKKKRNKIGKVITGFGGLVAGIVLVVALLAANDPTLANSIKGFASEIINWKGQVTGVEYNNATNEIGVTSEQAVVEDEKVIVPITVTLKNAEQIPYKFTEALTIGDIKIETASGEEILGEQIKVVAIKEKEFSFDIGSDKLLTEVESEDANERVFKAHVLVDKGILVDTQFSIFISSFFQHKKADAPLETHGQWQIDVSYKQ